MTSFTKDEIKYYFLSKYIYDEDGKNFYEDYYSKKINFLQKFSKDQFKIIAVNINKKYLIGEINGFFFNDNKIANIIDFNIDCDTNRKCNSKTFCEIFFKESCELLAYKTVIDSIEIPINSNNLLNICYIKGGRRAGFKVCFINEYNKLEEFGVIIENKIKNLSKLILIIDRSILNFVPPHGVEYYFLSSNQGDPEIREFYIKNSPISIIIDGILINLDSNLKPYESELIKNKNNFPFFNTIEKLDQYVIKYIEEHPEEIKTNIDKLPVNDNEFVFVAIDIIKKQIIGDISGFYPNHLYSYINYVEIYPEYRGKGQCRPFFGYALNYLNKVRNMKQIVLHISSNSPEFAYRCYSEAGRDAGFSVYGSDLSLANKKQVFDPAQFQIIKNSNYDVKLIFEKKI